MPLDLFPNNEALEGQYDEGYFGRVYRTSLIVLAIAAAAVGTRGGLPALAGLTYGAAISLGGVRLIEVVVRALFRPGVRLQPKWVTALMVLKLPLLSGVLAGGAWLTVHHLANPFALVGGLALVQAVIFLKAVGSLLVSALPAEPARAAAPWMSAAHRRLWKAGLGGVRTEAAAPALGVRPTPAGAPAHDRVRAGAGLPAPELSTLN